MADNAPITYRPNSSAISQIVFDPQMQTAVVTFAKTGKTTEVNGIDEETMNEWMASPSVGAYFVSRFQVR